LNLEEENTKKRKEASLTNSEWLTFFFFPFRKHNFLDFNSLNEFNRTEEERFKKFGFERKEKEASLARTYGVISYTAITIIIIYLIN